jgi:uncharacterized protein YidB (DUF937 family)
MTGEEGDMSRLGEWGSKLQGVLGGAEDTVLPGLLSKALAQTSFGNLQGLVDHLHEGGLASEVESWVGSNANMSISADQLGAVLGDEHVRQIAQHFGIDPDAALNLLAKHLPDTVSRASDQGEVASPA